MSTEEELKWMTKRYSWRYIPHRYQAMVATITSALLYFNAFNVFFEHQDGSAGACGSLFRPNFDGEEMTRLGWFWESGLPLFSLNTDLYCARHITNRWWELVATFVGLAVCGVVLRRAIKREEATKAN